MIFLPYFTIFLKNNEQTYVDVCWLKKNPSIIEEIFFQTRLLILSLNVIDPVLGSWQLRRWRGFCQRTVNREIS